MHSLGVLLYELLTGTTPVDRKSLERAALLEVLRVVRDVEAPRPRARLSSSGTLPSVAANRGTEPAKLSKLLKGELDWVLLKALEKDRTRRYDTANGLARDIQRHLADEVVEARPPSAGYRLRKLVRRNKEQVVAAGLVLLALVGGIAGTTFGLVEARRQERAALAEAAAEEEAWAVGEVQQKAAVAAAAEARENLAVARAVTGFLQDVLGQASGAKQAEQKRKVDLNLTVRAAMGYGAKEIDRRFAGQPVLEAEIRHTIGNTYHRIGDYRAAEAHLARAVALLREHHGDRCRETLDGMHTLASQLASPASRKEAETLFLEVIAGYRQL